MTGRFGGVQRKGTTLKHVVTAWGNQTVLRSSQKRTKGRSKWSSTEPWENASKPVSLKATGDLAPSNQKNLTKSRPWPPQVTLRGRGIYTPG